MLWEHEHFLIIYWQVNYNTGFRCVVECNFVPTLVDLVYSSFPVVYKLRRNFILTNKFSPRSYTKIFEEITRKQQKHESYDFQFICIFHTLSINLIAVLYMYKSYPHENCLATNLYRL